VIRLFDGSLSEIAFSDDNGGDAGDGGGVIGGAFNSRIETGILPAGTYYVQMRGFVNEPESGTYSMHISAMADCRTVPEPMTATVFGVSGVLAACCEWLRRRREAA
jgi:hypothetical protein